MDFFFEIMHVSFLIQFIKFAKQNDCKKVVCYFAARRRLASTFNVNRNLHEE